MSLDGLVVARHKRHALVATPDGERRSCIARERRLQPLVGDRVVWSPQPDGTGVIEKIEPRASLLTRIDSRGRSEPVAANVTQVVVVVAPKPAPDWFLVDRYLAAAELLGIAAAVVHNKSDLAAPPGRLATYSGIGYRVVAVSTKTGAGLDALMAAMRGRRSVLVGQSGVGKSSLSNALLDDGRQQVGALSGKGGHGRHTTSAATLWRLPGGGDLIDSPGVRNYSPYIEDKLMTDRGFRELVPLLGRCRFANCRHLSEPDCAVKQARDSGAIAAERYASYVKLRSLLEALPE